MTYEKKELTKRTQLQTKLGHLPPNLISDANRQKEVAYIINIAWQRLRLKTKENSKRMGDK